MSKQTDDNRSDYLEGIPYELRYMLRAHLHSIGQSYCVQGILDYLLDHRYENESFLTGVSLIDVCSWIIRSIELALFPLEQFEDIWVENCDKICCLINRAEEILKKIAPDDYKTGYRTSYERNHTINIIAWAQKLNVYYAFLYMYTENYQGLQEMLEVVLSDTQRNVQEMLSDEGAEKYAVQDDWSEYHYPGSDEWQTINWPIKEFLPSSKAEKVFAQVYEKYALFLYQLKNETSHAEVCASLHEKAEKRLRNLCDNILDAINLDMEDLDEEEEDKRLLLAETELYERMFRESEERRASVCLTETVNDHNMNLPF